MPGAAGCCPSAVKDRPLVRVKDLPGVRAAGGAVVAQTPLGAGRSLCPRRSFTQTCEAVRPRGRVTERLRDQLASAIAGSNRAGRRCGRRVRGVVADRAQGAGRGGGPLAAGAGADEPAGDR